MTDIFAQTDEYINDLFAGEDDILKGITASLYAIGSPMAEGSISPAQGKFLQLMAAACGARRILELGTLGGYSSLWLARALPEDGRLITIESNEDHAGVAKRNIARAGMENKVEIVIGKCIDVLTAMQEHGEQPFDLVFMDADKPPYAEYFQAALNITRPGSIIIADNVIREGKVLDSNSQDAAVKGVQRFNKILASESRVMSTIIQTVGLKAHDGMAIAVVK